MDIQVFQSPQFGAIRTAGTPDDPQFCLADVCKALGLATNGITRRLDKGVISNHPLATAGGVQQALFVNEDGLYDVILDSRKPEAKAFRKWVTGEVLPSIRKSGGYIATTEGMSDEDIMARAVLVAESAIKAREERIRALEAERAQLQKTSDYLNTILESRGTVAISQIAMDYGMSAIAFNRQLNAMHIQRKVNGQWILYSDFIGKGYVHSRTIHFVRHNGQPDTRMVTEWTQRGRLFLYDALKEAGIMPMIERGN